MSKHYLIFFFTYLLLLISNRVEGNWVEDRLKDLSIEEKDTLSFFFKNAIKEDHLGHVLFFSSKPACLIGGFLDESKEKSKLFFKGWKIWKAKEHLFPHPDFLIYETYSNTSEAKTLHIYFINKKTLHESLTQHEAVLKEKIGKEFSKQRFLKDLEEKQIAAFGCNEALTGFLLGYGIESSFAFKNEKQQLILCTKKENFELIPSKRSLLLKLKGINVEPLTFMGDPNSQEVQTLQKKYAIELERIEALFQEDNFLEKILSALCSEP
jgi:hypothetical protein